MKLAILSLAAVTLTACSTMPQSTPIKVNGVDIRKDPSHMTAKDYLIPALVIGGIIGIGYLASKSKKEPVEPDTTMLCRNSPAFQCLPYMGGP